MKNSSTRSIIAKPWKRNLPKHFSSFAKYPFFAPKMIVHFPPGQNMNPGANSDRSMYLFNILPLPLLGGGRGNGG